MFAAAVLVVGGGLALAGFLGPEDGGVLEGIGIALIAIATWEGFWA